MIIMKYMILSLRLFEKNKMPNMMVMIISFLTFYIFSTLYNQYYDFYKTSSYFEKTQLNSSLLFMGREPVFSDELGAITDPKYINQFVNIAQNSHAIKSISKMYNRIVEVDVGNRKEMFSFRAYDSITAGYIKSTLSIDGKWLFEERCDSLYPVVVRNNDFTNYKVGDSISFDITLTPETTLLTDNMKEQKITVKCMVVGVANNKGQTAFFLGPKKSNFIDTIENTFYCTPVSPNQPVIYFPYDDTVFGDYCLTSDTVLAYFREEATYEEIMDFYQLANSIGYSQLGSDIIKASKVEGDFKLKKNFFAFFSLIILMVISIFCVSFLNLKRTKKIFAVYYLNGCNKIDAFIIYYLYYLLIYLIPFFLFVFMSRLIEIKLLSSDISAEYMQSSIFKIDIKIVFLSWLFGLVISLTTTLISLLIIRKKSIINNLKESYK